MIKIETFAVLIVVVRRGMRVSIIRHSSILTWSILLFWLISKYFFFLWRWNERKSIDHSLLPTGYVNKLSMNLNKTKLWSILVKSSSSFFSWHSDHVWSSLDVRKPFGFSTKTIWENTSKIKCIHNLWLFVWCYFYLLLVVMLLIFSRQDLVLLCATYSCQWEQIQQEIQDEDRITINTCNQLQLTILVN